MYYPYKYFNLQFSNEKHVNNKCKLQKQMFQRNFPMNFLKTKNFIACFQAQPQDCASVKLDPNTFSSISKVYTA